MQGFFEHLKKWWAVYGTGVTLVAVQLLPVAQQFIAAHPRLDMGLGSALVVLAKVTNKPQGGN